MDHRKVHPDALSKITAGRLKVSTPSIGLADCSLVTGTPAVLDGKRSEVIVMKRHIVLFGFLILLVSAVGAQDKPSTNKGPARRTVATSGKQTYMHYCASCHGVDARGNGPAAFVLKTTPPDLTTLANRHGGKFPHQYVSDVLRFGTRILSHGSSDMPIWGPIFGSLDNYDEVAVRKRIKDLSDYLASLQQKES
jgi:mono/diheme cytochrome c family protein